MLQLIINPAAWPGVETDFAPLLLFVLVFSSKSNILLANLVGEELCLVGNKLPGVCGRDVASAHPF